MFINILGLALGLTITLFVIHFLIYELSFDDYHKEADRIYLVYVETNFAGNINKHGMTPPHLDKALKNNFPEIEESVSFVNRQFEVYKEDKLFKKYNFCATDSKIFNLFSFQLIRGNMTTCLDDPYSVIISEKFAKEYFGNIDVLNKTIKINAYGNLHDFKITGIIKNVPQNSSFIFDGIISNKILRVFQNTSELNWNTYFPICFIKIKPHTIAENLTAKFPSFVQSTGGDPNRTKIKLLPLEDVHFRTDIGNTLSKVEMKYLYIFLIVGFLVLTVSVFNYIGISLTVYSKRIKEIGFRKVAGANRRNLIFQFITENILITFLSLFAAIGLMELAFPFFSSILDSGLELEYSKLSLVFLIILGIVFIINLFTSFYFTFFFSSLKPYSLIKGEYKEFSFRINLRKGIVAVQFVIAIFLICCTLILIEQLNFIKHKDLGFNREQILIIDARRIGNEVDVLKNELSSYSNIKSVTKSEWFPGKGHNAQMSDNKNGKVITIDIAYIDENFIPTLDFEILEGRNFNPEFGADSNSFIINETLAKEFNEKDPIRNGIQFADRKYKVIGVVKDFNYLSLRESIEPIAFQFSEISLPYILVKIKKGKIKETLSFINQAWDNLNLNREIDYSFLDENLNKLYINENKIYKALSSASIIVVFIALMGIFALSSYLIESKTKEIAVRKVLGASISSVVTLLSSDFIKLIFISNLIAWPIAYFTMQRWLEDFAYRINIELWSFLFAGISALIIAFVTVSWQAIKAARANPVKSLKYE